MRVWVQGSLMTLGWSSCLTPLCQHLGQLGPFREVQVWPLGEVGR